MAPEFTVVATGEMISLTLHVFIEFSGIVDYVIVGYKENGSFRLGGNSRISSPVYF
jgi:hypothetical protein